jgi:hypothetical protein
MKITQTFSFEAAHRLPKVPPSHCQSRTKMGQSTGGIVSNRGSLARALARVLPI